jgi:hypothetical protein
MNQALYAHMNNKRKMKKKQKTKNKKPVADQLIAATQQVGIRGIAGRGQGRQKVSKTPISNNAGDPICRAL